MDTRPPMGQVQDVEIAISQGNGGELSSEAVLVLGAAH